MTRYPNTCNVVWESPSCSSATGDALWQSDCEITARGIMPVLLGNKYVTKFPQHLRRKSAIVVAALFPIAQKHLQVRHCYETRSPWSKTPVCNARHSCFSFVSLCCLAHHSLWKTTVKPMNASITVLSQGYSANKMVTYPTKGM